MAIRRYARDPILGFGQRFGTARAIGIIRAGIASGAVKTSLEELNQGDRLDIVAGRNYGDASLWWVIAAASEIGWALQVPPGTVLVVPNLQDVARLLG